MVKHGRGSVKRYGCIFVCMASRAIHLELAQFLETDDCIMVLRRFLNIRGNVKLLRSHNGTDCVSAERELREALQRWNQNQIEERLRQRGVHSQKRASRNRSATDLLNPVVNKPISGCVRSPCTCLF